MPRSARKNVAPICAILSSGVSAGMKYELYSSEPFESRNYKRNSGVSVEPDKALRT